MMEWLFGGTKTADTVVNTVADSVRGIGNFIDEQQYTDEEKAVQHSKLVDAHLEFLRVAYDQNSIRSITRRYLAWSICFTILGFATVAVVLGVMGKEQEVQLIIEVSKAFWLGEAFLAVVAFYFGSAFLQRGKL